MSVTTCPFCCRARAARLGESDLLVSYRCDYCFKEWREARVRRRPTSGGVVMHEFPRWLDVSSEDGG